MNGSILNFCIPTLRPAGSELDPVGFVTCSLASVQTDAPGALPLLETLRHLLDRGGWVMGVLLLLSVVAITLCLERAWFWWRQRGGAARVRVLAAALRGGDQAALERAVARHGRRGAVLESFALALVTTGGGAATPSAVLEAADRVRPRMERFMPALSTIVTAAPLLGILGTVVGIIASFELLGDARLVTDPRQVSGGIAEALLTTQAGLIIALTVLFPYMAFRHRLDRELGRLDLLIAAAEEGAASRPSGALTPTPAPGGGSGSKDGVRTSGAGGPEAAARAPRDDVRARR